MNNSDAKDEFYTTVTAFSDENKATLNFPDKKSPIDKPKKPIKKNSYDDKDAWTGPPELH